MALDLSRLFEFKFYQDFPGLVLTMINIHSRFFLFSSVVYDYAVRNSL